jgi:phage repressor protein C with HTH and peptisase S24 domain
MGTRQYPKMGYSDIPETGYDDEAMSIDPMRTGRLFRQRRGKTPQEEIARKTGVSQSAIDRMERGDWKKLSENVQKLARYYGVRLPDAEFDEHIDSSEVAAQFNGNQTARTLGVPELETRAGMGGGGAISIELRAGGVAADPTKPDQWVLPPGFVRDELRAAPSGLVILETQGDSMLPTLAPGERVFVDTRHKRPSPDGIYALRDEFGGLIVKRLHALSRGRFSIISDNPTHPAREIKISDLADDIVGRVVGAVKRL